MLKWYFCSKEVNTFCLEQTSTITMWTDPGCTLAKFISSFLKFWKFIRYANCLIANGQLLYQLFDAHVNHSKSITFWICVSAFLHFSHMSSALKSVSRSRIMKPSCPFYLAINFNINTFFSDSDQLSVVWKAVANLISQNSVCIWSVIRRPSV